MAMMTPSASAFSDAAWLRAVLVHVPRAATVVTEAQDGSFRLFAARRARLPLLHFQSVSTPLTPCPLPSVAAMPGLAETQNFLNGIGAPVLLRGVPVDHPVTQALVKAAGHISVLRSWERAALDLSGDFDSWMTENFDHKRRKELKRLKARLSEQGDLVIETLTPGADLTRHIKAFLEVEASGWKGMRGTAILNDEHAAKGLAAGLAAMHRDGKVRFWTMRLGDRPVASLFALVNGRDAVLGKIGYEQVFAKYSPGVLLIVEATKRLFEEGGLRLVDSNAIPDHPMIDRIWRDRITCMDVLIAGPGVTAAAFAVVSRFHQARAAARLATKKFYLRLTGRRES